MEIFILGSGGMMPIPERFLSSFMIRRDNDARFLLFDCGEGTQIQIKRMGLGWKQIDKILISHTHADHVTGLPGLLMLIGQADREAPLDIYGPPRIQDYIDSLSALEPVVPYPVRVHELTEEGTFFEDEEYAIECRWLDHTRPCMGYRLREHPRAGRFSVDRAAELGIPEGPERRRIVQGETVQLANGVTIGPEDVLGPPRPGLQLAYVTDTRPCPGAAELARDVDLFICEGMYAAAEAEDAVDKKHTTALEAASLAGEAGAKRLLLTHLSPRYLGPACRQIEAEAQQMFPQARLARDLETMVLERPA